MNILRMAFIMTILLQPTFSSAQTPAEFKDEGWISLDGTVVETDTAGFTLDYGSGFVRVRMNDWQWYNADHPIQMGDDVRVNGRVEDDKGEKPAIAAESVYVRDLNTYFSTEGGDDVFQPAIDQDRVFQLQGTITGTEGRQFTMNLGARKVIVDTSELPYNPLDATGYQQLKRGDTVQVTGELKKDNSPLSNNVILANTVTTVLGKEKVGRVE